MKTTLVIQCTSLTTAPLRTRPRCWLRAPHVQCLLVSAKVAAVTGHPVHLLDDGTPARVRTLAAVDICVQRFKNVKTTLVMQCTSLTTAPLRACEQSQQTAARHLDWPRWCACCNSTGHVGVRVAVQLDRPHEL